MYCPGGRPDTRNRPRSSVGSEVPPAADETAPAGLIPHVQQLHGRTLQRIAQLVEHVPDHRAPSCQRDVDAFARLALAEIDHDPGAGKPEGERTRPGAEYPTLAAPIRNDPGGELRELEASFRRPPSPRSAGTKLRRSCAVAEPTGRSAGCARTWACDSARPSVLTTRPRMTPVWSGGAAASGAAKGATNDRSCPGPSGLRVRRSRSRRVRRRGEGAAARRRPMP